MITRALVLIVVLVSGPWLVRQIALRLRHYPLIDDRVPPQVVAILMGFFAIASFLLLIAGLFSGGVHCFGRNCQVDTYHLASTPMHYWVNISMNFLVAVFAGSMAAISVLQWHERR